MEIHAHLKSIRIMMMGPRAAGEALLSLGKGSFHHIGPVIKRVSDHFSCWVMHNTCSIIRHSKSVCILKVLYITVIMHPGMPLAQLLTFPLHSSRERGNEPTGASQCMRNAEESLFTKRKQSFHRKSSRLNP